MDMEEQVDLDHQSMMIEGGMRIDPRREREDGVILDFAGPNCVSVDDFSFGAVARYVQINKDKEYCISSNSSALQGDREYQNDDPRIGTLTWDEALEKGMLEFQQRMYSLFTCNCHSFVANNLNRLGFRSGGWNVVNVAFSSLSKAGG
ncbi:Thioredoxin H-type 1, H1,TRX1 [Hibiscus syriacus]|uniref:Thioredoxin H-type 1, H1,TRX1 n=1 Tax=Hibiscus syriacus TaxID=106335 RepID=A0A6A2ZUC5_HIBSY|nr:Thioredoxin H-type 1, H1,TRX1 [Hibiscus syriacus]